MTTLHTLSSGSSGNALVLSCGQTHILLDVGISCRRITAALRALGLEIEDLSAVLITHTHTDHIAGLQTLIKRCRAPIYASEATARGLSYRLAGIDGLLRPFAWDEPFTVGSCHVTPFPTSHDAAGSAGYRLDTAEGSVGVLTDTGFVTEEAAAALPGVDLMVLEANHDVDMLRSGPYPYYLKQRILGGQGHLSNADAARFAVELAGSGTGTFILAHLSQENNTPAVARAAVESALEEAGLHPRLSVAPRNETGPAHYVERRAAPCRK